MPNLTDPYYTSTLRVLDVSPVLYTYTRISQMAKGKHVTTNVRGVNCSGVKAVLEMCARAFRDRAKIVLCLDNYGGRRSSTSEYKANRVYNPEIAVQSHIVQQFFGNMGATVLCREGMEADDFVYSVVHSNVKKFNTIEVYTGDSDIYGCVIDPKVTVIGVSSISPTIDVYNYKTCVKAEADIEYNFILPYHLFFGKPSNNLKKLKIDGMNDVYFKEFQKFTLENFTACEGSNIDVMIDFIQSGAISDRHLDTVIDRMEYVYPKVESVPFEKYTDQVDIDFLAQFCNYFGMQVAADIFGARKAMLRVEENPVFPTVMKRLYATIASGTGFADRGMQQLSLPSVTISESSEFKEVQDW